MTDINDLLANDFTKTGFIAVLGGIGFKIIERFFNSKEFVNEHTTLRAELRAELTSVKADVEKLRMEANLWRDRYYEQLAINTELQVEIGKLRVELDEYKERISNEFEILPDGRRHHYTDENPETD